MKNDMSVYQQDVLKDRNPLHLQRQPLGGWFLLLNVLKSIYKDICNIYIYSLIIKSKLKMGVNAFLFALRYIEYDLSAL